MGVRGGMACPARARISRIRSRGWMSSSAIERPGSGRIARPSSTATAAPAALAYRMICTAGLPTALVCQNVAPELREDLRHLAQQVVAVGSGEGAQILSVPPRLAAIPRGSTRGQRRDLGPEPRIDEERERAAAALGRVAEAGWP